ncbi:glutathione S-transferase family protein [Lutimaribacter marinistellae]|uniref:Glutathione S-transferase family protein n=1 Tax=Lutimaribacter marinistellae TaxID=1820329 RepID=A0ABV7TJY2_9RHOB
MTDMLRLHYAPDNASLIIRLALEEMGVPYKAVLVDRAARAQDTPAYRALNPAGLIPVLETPHGPVFETGAILLWLADRRAAARIPMAPAPDATDRGDFLKWLFFTANTVHTEMRLLFYPEKYAPGLDAEALRDGIRTRLRGHLGLLDMAAKANPAWLSPDRPSVLTCYLACLLRWMALYPRGTDLSWFSLSDTPWLHRVASAMETRPSARAAIAAEGLGATPFTAPTYATPPEGSAT